MTGRQKQIERYDRDAAAYAAAMENATNETRGAWLVRVHAARQGSPKTFNDLMYRANTCVHEAVLAGLSIEDADLKLSEYVKIFGSSSNYPCSCRGQATDVARRRRARRQKELRSSKYWSAIELLASIDKMRRSLKAPA